MPTSSIFNAVHFLIITKHSACYCRVTTRTCRSTAPLSLESCSFSSIVAHHYVSSHCDVFLGRRPSLVLKMHCVEPRVDLWDRCDSCEDGLGCVFFWDSQNDAVIDSRLNKSQTVQIVWLSPPAVLCSVFEKKDQFDSEKVNGCLTHTAHAWRSTVSPHNSRHNCWFVWLVCAIIHLYNFGPTSKMLDRRCINILCLLEWHKSAVQAILKSSNLKLSIWKHGNEFRDYLTHIPRDVISTADQRRRRLSDVGTTSIGLLPNARGEMSLWNGPRIIWTWSCLSILH